MANEILVLPGRGGDFYPLLFYIPISNPVQYAGAAVVLTPSSGLPSEASARLSAAQKLALDTGAAIYRIVEIKKDPVMSGTALRTRVQAMYAAQAADFNAYYDNAWRPSFVGQFFDAT